MEKEGKINLSILVFFPTIYLATFNVYTKLDDSGSHWSREICDRIFNGKKEKWTNGMVSRRRLILFYTIQKSYPTLVPDFKILGAVVPEKSLTKKCLQPNKHNY